MVVLVPFLWQESKAVATPSRKVPPSFSCGRGTHDVSRMNSSPILTPGTRQFDRLTNQLEDGAKTLRLSQLSFEISAFQARLTLGGESSPSIGLPALVVDCPYSLRAIRFGVARGTRLDHLFGAMYSVSYVESTVSLQA